MVDQALSIKNQSILCNVVLQTVQYLHSSCKLHATYKAVLPKKDKTEPKTIQVSHPWLDVGIGSGIQQCLNNVPSTNMTSCPKWRRQLLWWKKNSLNVTSMNNGRLSLMKMTASVIMTERQVEWSQTHKYNRRWKPAYLSGTARSHTVQSRRCKEVHHHHHQSSSIP